MQKRLAHMATFSRLINQLRQNFRRRNGFKSNENENSQKLLQTAAAAAAVTTEQKLSIKMKWEKFISSRVDCIKFVEHIKRIKQMKHALLVFWSPKAVNLRRKLHASWMELNARMRFKPQFNCLKCYRREEKKNRGPINFSLFSSLLSRRV